MFELPVGFDKLVNDGARGTIELNQFSKVFFPMFVAYFQTQDVELSRWLNYTKTKGYQWVDVMQGGEVVFSVPPIFQNTSITAGSGLKQDPSDILKIASIKDQTIPGAGNRHIRDNITDMINLKDDYNNGHDAFIEAWIPIFAYYNYTIDNGKGGSDNKTNDYNAEDFEDYDDL